MDKLPKVYAHPINHSIDNEQNSFKSYDNRNHNSGSLTTHEIDNILNSTHHIFRSKVKLNINGEYFEKTIISRNNDYLITIDNEKIPINSIWSIKLI